MEAVLLMIKARRQNQGEGDEQEPGDAFITLWTWEEYKLQGDCMGILQNIFHITSTGVLLTTLEFSPSECHLLTVPQPDNKKSMLGTMRQHIGLERHVPLHKRHNEGKKQVSREVLGTEPCKLNKRKIKFMGLFVLENKRLRRF